MNSMKQTPRLNTNVFIISYLRLNLIILNLKSIHFLKMLKSMPCFYYIVIKEHKSVNKEHKHNKEVNTDK